MQDVLVHGVICITNAVACEEKASSSKTAGSGMFLLGNTVHYIYEIKRSFNLV